MAYVFLSFEVSHDDLEGTGRSHGLNLSRTWSWNGLVWSKWSWTRHGRRADGELTHKQSHSTYYGTVERMRWSSWMPRSCIGILLVPCKGRGGAWFGVSKLGK